MKLKIADSLGDAAKNNSAAGTGLGLGAGIGMGMALPNMIQQSINPQNNESVSDKLKKIKELLDMGALTQDEFDTKKRELLKQI
jgi:membrane protease subunit (stomatin/prohibitin family)